jgi:hypothetical protein
MLLVLCAGALAVAGCGESKCSEAGHKICEKACACRAGDGCAITTGPPNFVTFSFDSESDCVGLFVTLGCTGGGDDSVDYAACSEALDDHQCVESGGAGEMGLLSPPECEAQPDAGT